MTHDDAQLLDGHKFFAQQGLEPLPLPLLAQGCCTARRPLKKRLLQVGSANLDARSLALNFECSVEVFGNEPATTLGDFFESVKAKARRVEVGELARRPVWENLRDSFFWMFKPYL